MHNYFNYFSLIILAAISVVNMPGKFMHVLPVKTPIPNLFATEKSSAVVLAVVPLSAAAFLRPLTAVKISSGIGSITIQTPSFSQAGRVPGPRSSSFPAAP